VISTQTGQLTLKLDLILHNKSILLVGDGLRKLGRDGVVSSLVLNDQALVTVDALVDGGLLYRPVTNVGPLLRLFRVLGLLLGLLLCVRRLPSSVPVVGELLEEGSFDGGRL